MNLRRVLSLSAIELLYSAGGSNRLLLLLVWLSASTFLLGYLIGSYYLASALALGRLYLWGFLLALATSTTYELQRISKHRYDDPVSWLPLKDEELVTSSLIHHLVTSSPIILGLFSGVLFGLSSRGIDPGLSPIFISIMLVYIYLAASLSFSFRPLIGRLAGLVRRGRPFLRFLLNLGLLVSYLIILTAGLGLLPSLGELWYIPISWPYYSLDLFLSGRHEAFLLMLSMTASLCVLTYLLSVEAYGRSKFELPPPRVPAGFWGKGPVVAMVEKDLKAFVRKPELLGYFSVPALLLFLIFAQPGSANLAFTTTLGLGIFVEMVGVSMLGLEGAGVWRLVSSPLRARQLLASKLTVPMLMGSLAMLPLVSALHIKGVMPDLRTLVVMASVIPSVSSGSVYLGFKAASYSETPYPKVVKPIPSLIAMVLGVLISLLVGSPLVLGLDPFLAPMASALFSLAFLFAGMKEAERLLGGYRSLGR